MSARIKENVEWIRFILTLVFCAALKFGDNRYVAKIDYTADAKRFSEAIVAMDKQIALLETERHSIDDHETRIRSLEAHSKLSYEIKKTPLGSGFTASLFNSDPGR